MLGLVCGVYQNSPSIGGKVCGFDLAKDASSFEIGLMDFAAAVMPDP